MDVSFWVIHPTLERLTIYKQMVNPFTDYGWDASAYEPLWNDNDCLWAGFFPGVSCTGHAKTDTTISEMLIFDENVGDFVKKHLTNFDVLKLTKPEYVSLLPYVYDNFDYSHCEAGGIKFKKVPKSDTQSVTLMKGYNDLLLDYLPL